jgi:hypothetical protein
MRGAMAEMMYSTAEEDFDNLWTSFIDTYNDQSVFLTYFTNQWIPKKHLWVKAWRPVSCKYVDP